MVRLQLTWLSEPHVRSRFIKALLLLTSCAVAVPGSGQQATVTFHQFKLPVGSWTNTMSGMINGQPSAPPQTSTLCSGPLSEAQAAALKSNRSLQVGTAGCKTTVIIDTPTLAVYTQECPIEHSTTTTLTKLNEHHVTTDIKLSQGSVTSLVHIDGIYNGPCTPAVTGPMPLPSRPSAEACEQITQAYGELAEARTACNDMEEEAPRCRARVDSELNRLKIQIGICQK